MNKENFHKFYTLYFIIFGIVISIIGASIQYFLNYRSLYDRVNQEAYMISQNKMNNILKSEIDSIDKVVKFMGNCTNIKQFLLTQDEHLEEEILQVLSTLLNANTKIFQARLIDKNGKEAIRVESKNNHITITDKSELQDKSLRYYFQTLSHMKTQQIWHSKIDLNVENEKIEIPYVSTIRAGIPVFYKDSFIGIFIINVNTNILLNSIGKSNLFLHYIVDKENNYILHPNENYAFNKYKNTASHFYEDFPNGLKDDFIYHYDLDSIINNDDDATLILKINPNYRKELFNGYFITAVIVLISTILLSILMGLYASRIPKKFQKALLYSRQSIENILSILDRYVITSKTKVDSTITDVSFAFEKSSGYKKEELIGKRMNIIRHHEQDIETFANLWENNQWKSLEWYFKK